MSATSAVESGQTPPLDYAADHNNTGDDAQQLLLNTQDEQNYEHDTSATPRPTHESSANDVDAIKVEDVSGRHEHVEGAGETSTSLRPAPPPSIKRRESETPSS